MGAHKLLIVEDNPRLKTQLEWASSGEMRNIRSVTSAAEAIQLIQREFFDIIITDIKMETDEAGLDVLRVAKQTNPDTQVIVVTSYNTPELNVATMAAGAFTYIARSKADSYLIKLKNAIVEALQSNEEDVKEEGENE